MLQTRINKFIRNPKKALWTLSFPILIAMVVQIMYNIVDTAFIGRLGAESIAALTFSFPLLFILIALNSGIGVGMGSRISRFLGEKNKKAAENTAMHGLFIALIVALLLFIIGMIYLKPIFSIFGAADNVMQLAVGYMSIILLGVFFMFPSFTFSQMFVSQGDAKTPMKIQVSALILNIILDPVFIYVLGYGVKGAAIATVISILFGLSLFIYLINKRSHLKIKLSSFKFSLNIGKQIFSLAIPASMTMLMISFYIMFINRFMMYFGVNYVASFGIVSRLESIAVMPIIAVSVAMMTLVGMFFGAGRYDLLKKIVKYGIKRAVFFTSFVGLIFFIIPTLFLRIFTPDQALLTIGAVYLRIDVFTFPLMSVGMMTGRVMQGMGFGLPGLIITVVRIFIVAIPLAYLFIFIFGFGYVSIAVAMVLGGIINNIVALIWLKIKFKKLHI